MGVVDELVSLGKILKQVDKIDEYKKILDLTEKITELISENEHLKNRNKELSDLLNLRQNLVFQENMYWLDNGKIGPYCSNCFDQKHILVRLHNTDNYYRCPACKTSVPSTGAKERGISTIINTTGW